MQIPLHHLSIARPALRNAFLGLGLLLMAAASIELWSGQEPALLQWALGAFFAPSLPFRPHSQPSHRKARIGTYATAMAVLSVAAAIAAIWLWSRSENPYRHYVLGTFLPMLACGWLMMKFKSFAAQVGFLLSFAFLVSSVEASYYKAPLSGEDLSRMSFSQCERDRLQYEIQSGAQIDRRKLSSTSSHCKKEEEKAIYKESDALAEKQKTDFANDQLKALGFPEKKM